jgi:hypothetical protein
VIFLLSSWPSHADYQRQTAAALSEIAKVNPYVLREYEIPISKLYILNLDPLKKLIAPLYSATGRPATNQPGIFRSLILMLSLGYPLFEWIKKLANNPILQIICGFQGKLPGIASYYDFINRLFKLDDRPRHKAVKRKPKKKVGKGKKLPPKHPGIVKRMAEYVLAGRRFNCRPERILQEIFAAVAVQPSIDLGLIPRTVSISGDGTCIETGASPYGVKTCGCNEFLCDCPRKFSDPYATWGWDSHNEHWFYGYTGYFISTYNRAEKLDLPLYLRLLDAKRHDSISAVVALAEFRDLYPNLKIDTFISDSASDNYATYELLDKWGINAVIALNKTNSGNPKYPESLKLDDNGVPICPGGYKMIYYGYCGQDRCRLKWRCPKACGKRCDNCVNCSNTAYGRTTYTKPEWDLRLFCSIPRGTQHWKSVMKERTAAERVNNRILNHYGIEQSHTRGKKRISFFTTIAGFNIHLDAQLAKLKASGQFDYSALFALQKAA